MLYRVFLYLAFFITYLPFIDKYITRVLYKQKKFYRFSRLFSNYIIHFNIIVNIYVLLYKQLYQKLILRYFIELVLINVVFKMFLDRPRPRNSYLIKKNLYIPVYKIRPSKNWYINQSFPSGHMATIYLTYFLTYNTNVYLNYLYFSLIGLTLFCRINAGAHYLSDCVSSIIICNLFKSNLI
jgi:membrane-associated phospholipid phosphatase